MSSAPESVPSPRRAARRRRRRPILLTVLAVALIALLAVGIAAAVYVGGLARSVDQDTKRFDGGAFPSESLRPGAAASSGADASFSAAPGNPAPGVWSPTAPPPGMDPALAGDTPQGPQAPSPDEAADGQAVDFLLVGADTGTEGRDPEGRSDSLMWVHVPGDRHRVDVMSIMRDFWVPVPGHGDRKVNAAYQFGGIPLTVATAENMFQTRVDHVVAVDMAGFQGLVDALGGVTVDNPRAFTAMNGMTFAAGPIQLDGPHALAFARERYALPRSDFDRVENQQRLVKAIIAKLLSMDTLSDPARVQESVSRFAPYVTMDDSLNSGSLASLVWSLRGARSAPIVTSTVPSVGVGYTPTGEDVVWPDWAAIHEIGRGIRTGTLGQAGAR